MSIARLAPLTLPRVAAASVLLLAAAAAAVAAPVTVNTVGMSTIAYDGSGFDQDDASATAWGTRTLVSGVAGASSSTRADWVDSGSGALLDFDFDHVRNGVQYAHGLTQQSTLIFTVGSADTRYALGGRYATSGSAGRVYAELYFTDLTTGQRLFGDYSESRNSAGESFDLGTANDGDTGNSTSGSLTGTLIAGHRYQLWFTYFIQALDRPDTGARASGCVSLALGTAAVDGVCGVVAENAAASTVPEPASLALAAGALAFAGLARRRRA